MKKKLLCLMLIFVMCFPTGIALAADKAVDMETGAAVEELSAYVVTKGDEADANTFKNYVITIPGDTKEVVIPITFDERGLLFSTTFLESDLDKNTVSVYEEIFSDAACTDNIGYSSWDDKTVIKKSGTYYVRFSILDFRDDETSESYTASFKSQFYSAADVTLKNKTWVSSGSLDFDIPNYFKVEVPKTGSLTVNVATEYTGSITLLNSKKKAISEVEYYEGEACFAVEKGTYYYKVTNATNTYLIKSTFTPITEKSGNSKKNAKKLDVGKKYTGCLTANDKTNTADWYKLTIPKSQEVSISLIGSVTSGYIYYELFGDNISGSIKGYLSSLDDDESFVALTEDSDNLPKGTYYIKLYKYNKETSGTYSIKFNK